MANELAEIECFDSEDYFFCIVHKPDGSIVAFLNFEMAKQYCFERDWDIFVINTPWDEEIAEWQ